MEQPRGRNCHPGPGDITIWFAPEKTIGATGMPELPEVETIRLGLLSTVVGEVITGLTVSNDETVLDPPSVSAFAQAVAGRVITGVGRRGKYLLLALDDSGAIEIHLRMTGQVRVLSLGAEPLRFERACIRFESGQSLRFADQRKFGRIVLLDAEGVKALDAKLGVEPLSIRFSANWLLEAVSERKRPIKAFLLDQHLIAGIGNIYADEALFRARIHPLTPSGLLTETECAALVRSIRHVLRAGIDHRGTSFSSYADHDGAKGQNQFSLQVYGKGRGQIQCPQCGGPLICIQAGGRSSHLCERCQVLRTSRTT